MSECSISRFAIYSERLYSGISGEAAVDRQNHARDKACSLIVYKEEKSALQLLGFTESAHGSCGKYLARSRGGSTVGIEEKRGVLLGGEEAGSNSVYSDAYLGEMHGKPLGEVRYCRLGTRVRGDLGEGSICVHRGNIQNIASLSAYHLASKRLGGNKRAEEV